MIGHVIRICDYERKSRQPDAVDRDPSEPAIIILLPCIKIERFDTAAPPPPRGRRLEKRKSR